MDGPHGKKIIEIDPDTAPAVQKMFERYVTGQFSMKQIGEMAIEEGLELKREGNIAAVIQYALKNPIYAGGFIWKGRRYEGIHTPLVTKEIWDKVQGLREERRTRKRRRVKRNFAFGRMISCGHCGCTLVGEIKKGKYVYYRCTHYKTGCDEPYVREEVLEEKFTDILRMIQFDEEVLDWIKTALKDSRDDERCYHREVSTNFRRTTSGSNSGWRPCMSTNSTEKSESDSTKRSPPNGGKSRRTSCDDWKSIRVLLSPTWTREFR